MKQIINTAFRNFVTPFYAEKDAAHDIAHIERIIRRLETLAAGMPGQLNYKRLQFLSYFHGIWKRVEADVALKADTKKFLESQGWSQVEIDDALSCLTRHLHSPESIEEKIVHDANYVELLGAFGVAKAFTKGGSRGQSYEDTADIYEYEYLDKVEFYTPEARRLAEEGRKFAKEFMLRLRQELSSL